MKIRSIYIALTLLLAFSSACTSMELEQCKPLADVAKIEEAREVLKNAFRDSKQLTFSRYESLTTHKYEVCGPLIKAEFTLTETPDFTPTEGGRTYLIDLESKKIILRDDN